MEGKSIIGKAKIICNCHTHGVAICKELSKLGYEFSIGSYGGARVIVIEYKGFDSLNVFRLYTCNLNSSRVNLKDHKLITLKDIVELRKKHKGHAK